MSLISKSTDPHDPSYRLSSASVGDFHSVISFIRAKYVSSDMFPSNRDYPTSESSTL